jgi:uncharacterized Zn finger protein
MREIDPCPFCRSIETKLIEFERHQWSVVCDGCGAVGPTENIPVKAREAWGAAVRTDLLLRDISELLR